MDKQASGTEMAMRDATADEFHRRMVAEYACWVHGLVPVLKMTREQLSALYPDKKGK